MKDRLLLITVAIACAAAAHLFFNITGEWAFTIMLVVAMIALLLPTSRSKFGHIRDGKPK